MPDLSPTSINVKGSIEVTVSGRVKKLAGFTLVALLATGCSAQLPGAAGVVGDARVSNASLDDAVTETQTALVDLNQKPVPVATLTQQNLTRLVTSELLAVAAQRRNIVVTAGDVDREIATAEQQSGADALKAGLASQRGVPPSAIPSFARDVLIEQALAQSLAPGQTGQAQVDAVGLYLGVLSKELDIRISPRYGTWDAKQLTLGPVPNNLSTVVAPAVTAPPSGFPAPVAP